MYSTFPRYTSTVQYNTLYAQLSLPFLLLSFCLILVGFHRACYTANQVSLDGSLDIDNVPIRHLESAMSAFEIETRQHLLGTD